MSRLRLQYAGCRMTQYRLDKATNTWLKYDEKADVWRPTVEGATGLQKANAGGWEAIEASPVVQVSRQALQPYEPAQDAISVSSQGRQVDDAESVARGILIQALPVIGLSFPLSICICGLAWLSGIVSAGFLAYVISVLGLWGGLSLLCYARVASKSHAHSYYGVERLKVESLTGIRHQEMANDYALKRAALDAYLRHLGGKDHD